MSLILDGTNGLSDIDGSAATPAIRGTDANTGIFFPAADTIAFAEGGAEAMRIDSAGAVLAGTASSVGSSPTRFQSKGGAGGASPAAGYSIISGNDEVAGQFFITASSENSVQIAADPQNLRASSSLQFATDGSERARIDSSGNLLVGKTSVDNNPGIALRPTGEGYFVRSGADVLSVNRLSSDGQLVVFYQDTVPEGNISVSGTTVSYNGGHLSRYAQTTTAKDDSIVKGTVLSNLDEMNVYTKDGQPVDNEQLNKVKVSDIEGDANVAGVFVNWSHDEQHNVDEINMAMTGDMIIRIAQGVTVVRGDLLMSAGDGTAKPQGDDIVRSKTVAKVTSNHITCTYADGSYCVPCVLMAC